MYVLKLTPESFLGQNSAPVQSFTPKSYNKKEASDGQNCRCVRVEL